MIILIDTYLVYHTYNTFCEFENVVCEYGDSRYFIVIFPYLLCIFYKAFEVFRKLAPW